jgi:anaerobic selenocysteine-containing dehydrogenase
VKDGQLIEVEGISEHPANEGTLCAKGAASIQYVYAKNR